MALTINIGNTTVTIADELRQPCEVWSRVMGYYRPVDQWNPGKQQEFRERANYQIIHPHL